MRKTTEKFWNAIVREYRESYSTYQQLRLKKELKDKYLDQCDGQYNR